MSDVANTGVAGFDYAETLVDSYISRAELGPEPIYFHLSESVTVRMIILRHKTIINLYSIYCVIWYVYTAVPGYRT